MYVCTYIFMHRQTENPKTGHIYGMGGGIKTHILHRSKYYTRVVQKLIPQFSLNNSQLLILLHIKSQILLTKQVAKTCNANTTREHLIQ